MKEDATINICHPDGTIICSPLITKDAERVEELMQSDYAQLQWYDTGSIALPAGSFILDPETGERLTLLDPYEPEQTDEATYDYRPVFQSCVMGWGKVPFFFYTYDENGVITAREADWTITDNAANLMRLICNAIFNETGEEWTFEVDASLGDYQTISFSATDIRSGLSSIAQAFDTEWLADKPNRILKLGKAMYGFEWNDVDPETGEVMPTPVVTLNVGENVGVPSVTESKEGYYNRFYVFGSTRNITQEYQGANVNNLVNKRLTLDPARFPDGYIDMPREAGEPVYPKVLTFDEIYPHSGMTISNLRPRLMYRIDENKERVQVGTDKDGKPVYDMYSIWYFQIEGFKLNDSTYSADNPDGMLISGKQLSVHFKSGALTGREFELIYHPEAKMLQNSDGQDFKVLAGDYEIKFIEESGFVIPAQAGIVPTEGNEIILFNLRMPQQYVATAYAELEAEARKTITERYTADLNNYTFNSNPVAFHEADPNLSVGQAVRYVNGEYSYDTRVIKIVRKLDYSFEQEITIGSEKIKGNTATLREEVVNANKDINLLAQLGEMNNSLSQSYQRTQQLLLDGLARMANMWEFHPTFPDTITTRYNILGQKEITAYGNGGGSGSGSGSGAGGGASYLRELLDVSIPGTPSAGQVLMWKASALNGAGAWVASSISAGLDEAALGTYLSKHGYATQSYVTNLIDQIDLSGYVLRSELPDWSKFALATDLENYVTNIALADTLAGYVTIGTEQTIKARKRFEREIVLGSADDHVTLSYADGALHVDGHVLARGEITAYGYAGDGSIGTGLLLGDLADVETAGAEDGMALVYSGGKWKPGAVAAGDVSGDYVTIETEQYVTGLKKFKSHIDIRGTNDAFTNRPYLLLHMPDVAYSKMVIDNGGHWHLVEGGQTDYVNYRKIKAAGFVTPGGTASQFLKADGSVDGIGYFYHRRDESGVNIDTGITASAGGLYELHNPAGTLPCTAVNNWYKVMDWGANDAKYRVQLATTLTDNSALYLRHKFNGNWQAWRMLLDTLNYAGVLDGRYVKKAGDTMTGTLTFAKTPTLALINGTYNTAGATSNVIWCDPATNRVIYGSPLWSKVILETSSDCAYRQNTSGTYKIWDSGNDGSGSGLDADMLDGIHAGGFIQNKYLGHNSDTKGCYVVLSHAYNGTTLSGSYFYGSVTFTRGSSGSFNAKTKINVQCGGQYASNITAYQTLVNNGIGIQGIYRIKYNGTYYLALKQSPGSTMQIHVQGFWEGITPFIIDNYAGATEETLINGTPTIGAVASAAVKLQTARNLWGNAFDGSADVNGGLTFGVLAGTAGRNLLYQQMADNDYFRIYVGATASNAGYAEIATADDGNEPIYVRQYTGAFVTVTRTLTLLDAAGSTHLPGNLHFQNNWGIVGTRTDGATGSILKFASNNALCLNYDFRAKDWIMYYGPCHVWYATTSASESMRIHTNGYIGFGNSAPADRVHVNGHVRVDNGSIAVTQSSGNNGYGVSLYGDKTHTVNYGILFSLTTYLGKHGSVQGDWATYLTMAGADNRGWIFWNNTKRAGVFSISAAGNVLANGEVTAYSDARLKQSIREVVPLRGSRLRPVSYYKDGARHVGLIAQDVQPLCPEAVHTAGDYLALSYNAALVYGFAGVYSEIDALRERVRELEMEVKLLKAA